MRRIGGALLAVTGVLACPCHLVVTLPLLAGLLAGTALGNVLTHNTGLISTGAGISFVGALAASMLVLVRAETPAIGRGWSLFHLCAGRN